MSELENIQPVDQNIQNNTTFGRGEKFNPKYIFVSGGGLSGIGKGIATASIGKVMEAAGYRVTALKIDPYFNIDPGTMNPKEHGEVFVTDDGSETDQDLGNYERFLNTDLNKNNYTTQGQILKGVFEKERRGEYQGRTVEAIPHIRNEVIEKIKKAQKSNNAEVVMIELGGTVGESQNSLFFSANKRMKHDNPSDVAHLHLAFIPTPKTVGEPKTKIAQSSIGDLNAMGIQPDIILARAEEPLDLRRVEKLADACDLYPEQIVSAPDVNSIYEVPINFEDGGLTDQLLKVLNLPRRQTDLKDWRNFVFNINNASERVRIAMVGKYFKTDEDESILTDAYVSVIEAVKHAAFTQGLRPEMSYIPTDVIEKKGAKILEGQDGLIVPGGFGYRGTEQIMDSIRYARERKMPYLGLCYGMQLAVIEYARNMVGMSDADTTENSIFTNHPVIDLMPDQELNVAEQNLGGTMRLGAYPALLAPDSLVAKLYGTTEVSERHRHRYEVNNEYRNRLDRAGLRISGTSPDGRLVEFIEVDGHPFFIGTQAHPELKSRPLSPHPLFMGFIKASAS